MGELSITAPAKGDPITAAWAQAVTDAANGAQATDERPESMRTPDGLVAPPKIETDLTEPTPLDMAFDVKIAPGENGEILYIALPSTDGYVVVGGKVCSPRAAQNTGDGDSAYVELETASAPVHVFVGFECRWDSTLGMAVVEWGVFTCANQNASDAPQWVSSRAPIIPIASYTSGSSPANLTDGLVQHHRGAIAAAFIGDADGSHSGASTANPGAAGGFCSIESVPDDEKHVQLYGFNWGNRIPQADVDKIEIPGLDIVLRENDGSASPTYARIRYIVFADVVNYLRSMFGEDIGQWIADHLDELMGMFSDFVDANDGPFWRTGGDEHTCNGSAIGNLAKSIVIDLLNLELIGDWTAKPANNGAFTVDGALDVTGDTTMAGDVTVQGSGSFGGNLAATGNIDATGDVTVGGNLSVTGANATFGGDASFAGDVGAVNIQANGELAVTGNASVGGDLAVTGQLSGGSLKINGNVYVPAQITYTDGNGNPQTITVLKQQ